MTVVTDVSGLRERLIDRYQQVGRHAVELMFEDMRRDGPFETGHMLSELYVDPLDTPPFFVYGLSCPVEYASYQEEGTGVYGPQGTPITPVSSKVLVFYWPKSGKVEFRTSVLGSPATHWWSEKIAKWDEYVAAALAEAD